MSSSTIQNVSSCPEYINTFIQHNLSKLMEIYDQGSAENDGEGCLGFMCNQEDNKMDVMFMNKEAITGMLTADSWSALKLSIPEKKITFIPNGVEKRFSEGDPALFYNKYGVKDFILNVGHIGVPRKKTLSLIRALSKIDHPSVIIGRIYPSKEADLCMEEGSNP